MVIIIYAAVAALVLAGMFLLFGVKGVRFAETVYSPIHKMRKAKIRKYKLTGKKLTSSMKRMEESEEMIEYTGRGSLGAFQILAVISGITGLILGLAMENFFLAIILCVAATFIPYSILRFLTNKHRKNVLNALETTLHTVTNRYMQTPDFTKAVQDSIVLIPRPLNKVFHQYLFAVENIDPSVSAAVETMKAKYDNPLWRDWCDTVIQCQNDSNLRISLMGIAERLSEMKRAQYEMDTIVQSVYREYITMVIMILFIIGLVVIVMPDWGNVLFTTGVGRVLVALLCLTVLVTALGIVRFNKPIDYK